MSSRPRVADSGVPSDDVHTVHLKGPEGRRRLVTIRGPLPASLQFDGVVFTRSGFAERTDGGMLSYTYVAAE
jgi:hypothetical protein